MSRTSDTVLARFFFLSPVFSLYFPLCLLKRKFIFFKLLFSQLSVDWCYCCCCCCMVCRSKQDKRVSFTMILLNEFILYTLYITTESSVCMFNKHSIYLLTAPLHSQLCLFLHSFVVVCYSSAERI